MKPSIISIIFLVSLSILSIEGGSISESLKKLLSRAGKKDVILDFPSVLEQIIEISSLRTTTNDDERNDIISRLKESTRISQLPVMNAISSLGLADQTTSFWIANRIALKGVDSAPIKLLAAIPGNFVIREAYKAKIFPLLENEDVDFGNSRDPKETDKPVQWGVDKINAPKVWDQGNIGQGVVVGIIDTGVNYKHVALEPSYLNRGNNSWFDAFGQHPDAPYDGNGHGSHCTGTIAGTMNGIGVAPGAKWIACRGLDDEGSGNETTLLDCGQFMACPSGNSSSACSGFPNVVSNSWGGLIGGLDFYNPVITVWRSMGIIPVFALGNSGPFCMSAGSPGDQDNLISVGATDVNDQLARFSSRGPALKTMKTKPEVSAPGAAIISATHDGTDTYRKLSGTSMACPHVAGAIALILNANPKLDFAGVKTTLESSAVQPKLGLTDAFTTCTLSFPPTTPRYPNNGFGYGRIDAEAAVAKAKATK